MALCCEERTRNGSSEDQELSPASKNTTKNFSLEYLSDELLVEILRRLPTAKSVVGFKLVSKRWSSLISTPYFPSQFITHHININKDNHYHAAQQFKTHSAVFVCTRRNRRQYNKLFLISTDHKKNQISFESPTFTLEFLPEKRACVSVVAVCDDLMLNRARRKGCITNYYICNPFTMKWLLLPPPPVSDSRDECNNNFGLVYEPNYKKWIQGINECRFRVVYIRSKGSYVLMHMYKYCSETGQRNKTPQLGSEYYVQGNIVAYYGKLHWVNDCDVFAYDPFKNETIFVELLVSEASVNHNDQRSVMFCLGICQGVLQVIKVVNYTDRKGADCNLSVWELKYSEDRSLNLKKRILFGIDSSSDLYSWFMPNSLGFHLIAFHPNDKNLVYLLYLYDDIIIECKIQRGKLEVVGKSSYPRMSIFDRDVFTTVLPWWSTPVPTLPQNTSV